MKEERASLSIYLLPFCVATIARLRGREKATEGWVGGGLSPAPRIQMRVSRGGGGQEEESGNSIESRYESDGRDGAQEGGKEGVARAQEAKNRDGSTSASQSDSGAKVRSARPVFIG
jgi:hypothetical protein